jgi:hypothetical protein
MRESELMEFKERRTVILKVGEENIPLNPFVQDFIKGTTVGMLKSLKKTDIKEGDIIELKMLVGADDLR